MILWLLIAGIGGILWVLRRRGASAQRLAHEFVGEH
jgi:hypothetical protein